jgi:hypothetical protein
MISDMDLTFSNEDCRDGGSNDESGIKGGYVYLLRHVQMQYV